MVKIKVKYSFIDVHTNTVHPVGEVIEVSEERLAEINSVNPDLVQVVREKKKKGESDGV